MAERNEEPLSFITLATMSAIGCASRSGDDEQDNGALVQEASITFDNFKSHPRVLEVDTVVTASEASIAAPGAAVEGKGIYEPGYDGWSPGEPPPLCGYGEIGRRLSLDAAGRIRKAERAYATDHTFATVTQYFDEGGALRYVQKLADQNDGANDYRHETLGYLNDQGQLFFEAFRTAKWPEADPDPDFAALPFGAPDQAASALAESDYPDNIAAARTWFEAAPVCR